MKLCRVTVAAAADARSVVDFWNEAGHALWFTKDPGFDARFRERFLTLHEAAARGELARWTSTADGALALIILLDQFTRNAFRGTPRMYATDALARQVADAAIAAGHDRAMADDLAVFFYLPFGHSETLSDQERCVALAARLGDPHPARARHHCDIVRRFGRFPHRNAILGRLTTAEEQCYLDDGGWSSGGFIADSVIDGQVNSGTQQQWLSRNSQWSDWTGANWNTVFVGRLNAGSPVTSSPASSTVPALGSSKPAIIRSVVVLPQPEGPSSVKNCPSGMSRSISRTAVKSPNFFVTP